MAGALDGDKHVLSPLYVFYFILLFISHYYIFFFGPVMAAIAAGALRRDGMFYIYIYIYKMLTLVPNNASGIT